MKRGRSDDSPTSLSQSVKFSRNPNNERKIAFQLNEPFKNEISSTSEFKTKTHQSTPYPKEKLKKLRQEDDDVIGPTANTNASIDIVEEKRNPEFLNKLGSLNRSFVRWIDIYFDKGYNYDFTPVCNDYIRFINNLKDKYPVENSETSSGYKLDNSSFNNANRIIGNSLSNASSNSPIKDKFSLFSSNAFVNTPPPMPGDKDYKSTPFPKHLLNKQTQNADANKQDSKLEFKLEPKQEQADHSKASTVQQPIANQENDKKNEIKFPNFLLPTGSSNGPAQFNNLGTSTNLVKNLFEIKPKLSNNISTPDKLGLTNNLSNNSTDNKTFDKNFFSPENLQFNQSKTVDQSMNNSSTFNFTANTSTVDAQQEQNEDEENYVPTVCQVDENAVYSVKCKLFFKKGESYAEKGVGTLYVKETNEESGNQLLIRAENSLGTILLNIRLNKNLPIVTTKSGLLLTCIPNPPLDDKNKESTETASFYIKVKTNEIRDELKGFIKKYSI